MIVAMDYMGLEEIAKKCLLYVRRVQFPDGSIRHLHYPDLQYYEITGYVLWAWTRHYLLTRDEPFLREIYPGVKAAAEWLKQITRKDPLGLLPPATINDDAMLANVRQTGQSLWFLIGLKSAIRMAEATGQSKDVEAFKAEYERYWNTFEKHLSNQLAKTGGSIPPALERTVDGNRWDDLLLLYPEPLFEPFDPRVTATIRDSREGYVEGILNYTRQAAIGKKGQKNWPSTNPTGLTTIEGDQYVFDNTRLLHYWQTPNNAQNALVRGASEDQQWAVKDLYALLLHTSSTHAPQEYSTVPWSTRDHSDQNLLPDGAASAKTIELMRNMIIREYKNDLVLFSALSPDWLQPGKTIQAINAPTNFGPLSLVLRANSNFDSWNLEVKLSNQFRQAPERVVIRIPWFYEAHHAEADGHRVELTDDQLILSPTTREVKISGRIKPGTPEMSFNRTVEDYKKEYRRRYEEFLRTGITQPSEEKR
jgi:hypothetical protein